MSDKAHFCFSGYVNKPNNVSSTKSHDTRSKLVRSVLFVLEESSDQFSLRTPNIRSSKQNSFSRYCGELGNDLVSANLSRVKCFKRNCKTARVMVTTENAMPNESVEP